ncbi:MAG TPA: alanine racemase [Caldisericia bacterium]|nr:alanine racemase [Caldisericia bacterium]HPF49019.1 alanine racemase [Caldisericia bacterium]HPI83117.1 alanine racemase [Caldisericia bacterium]HPQ92344.1 alanine racemase [Caldisericia bacterium]HRV74558.1 alanine racemase [Caldisericia bacterium]
MSLAPEKILPSIATVDLDKLKTNLGTARRISRARGIIGVVKANAYGHGIVPIAQALTNFGVDMLGVQTPEEAVKLRESGITANILIFGYTHSAYAADIIHYNLTPTIFDHDLAVELNRLSSKPVDIHVKIDTGMAWAGISTIEALPFVTNLVKLERINIAGLFTHFASADTDPQATKRQAEMFLGVTSELKSKLSINPILHACNSAATMNHPEFHFDMIRPGLMLYGEKPGGRFDDELLPILSWETTVCNMRILHPGDTVGYGRTYEADKTIVVGTVPVGYADGWRWHLGNKGSVIIEGKRCPIVGRVCMDQFMIDLTEIPSCEVGTKVTLIGENGGIVNTAFDIAKTAGTISYEILTSLGGRTKFKYTSRRKEVL